MNRRRVIIVSVVTVAVVAVSAMVALSVSANSRQTPPGRTATVTRGTITAAVTASGNVTSSVEIDLQLTGSAGTVTQIFVREGQRVTRGQALLRIDDSAARRQLATAEASLASARAQLTTATQGRSAAEKRVDQTGIESARTSVRNAERSLAQAQESLELDRSQQNRLVRDAENGLSDAREQKLDDEDALEQAENANNQSEITRLQSAITSDEASIDQAQSSLTQARLDRDSQLLKSRQAVDSQRGQVSTAEDQLSTQQAQAAANQQDARRGAVDSAQAQIDSAAVTVREARTAVADTVLRAPRAGTVATISAVVGQSSSAASSGGGAATSTGGTSDSAGGAGSGSGAGAGSASGTSSADTSGLVTLVDPTLKQVEAAVAEADVRDVRVGLPVDIRFPATGATFRGKVLQVDTLSTITDNVVEYVTTVSLPSNATTIRLGQTTSISVVTASRKNVLIVPTGTVTIDGGKSYVTRRSNGIDERVEVRTGLVGAAGLEIRQGLRQGDEVVQPGTGASPDAAR